jgi:hypothetical protein
MLGVVVDVESIYNLVIHGLSLILFCSILFDIHECEIKIYAFYIMVGFDNDVYTARSTGHFHGLESREAGTADAASRIAAQRAFGTTGDVNLLRGHSVPDGATLIGTLGNSNAWNYGETRGNRREIASLVNAANAGRKGGRNNKSKRRKSRKGNKSKKRKSRKTSRRRR